MGGTKGGSSTGFQQPQSMGQMGSSDLGSMMPLIMDQFMRFTSPQYAKRNPVGSGSKGAMPVQQQQQPATTLPTMPDYVNYQQMPVYSSQTVMPSQAITDFTSGYASGGAAKERTPDDENAAALRIVRLLGELKKKL